MKIFRHKNAIPNFSSNYNDLPPVPIIGARLGSTAPTLTTFVGNIEQFTFDATNDFVIGATEITHGYKEGTDIEIHLHWATNGIDGTDRYVKWQIEYTLSNNLGSFLTSTQTISNQKQIPASTPDRTHLISVLGTITGTSIKIGTYICWRLNRISAVGSAPSSNPFAIALGFHVDNDTIGSRYIYIK